MHKWKNALKIIMYRKEKDLVKIKNVKKIKWNYRQKHNV